MKKTTKLFLIAIITFASLLCLTVFIFALSNHKNSNTYNYLIAGVDNTAENTDVLMLVNWKPIDSELTIVQIPRDTYFKYGSGYNKINGIYSHYRSKGISENESLNKLTEKIECAFGVKIESSFLIELDALKSALYSIGEITVNLPKSILVEDVDNSDIFRLNVGENTLSPEQIIALIRFRKGYINGDLSRIEVQKLVISGLIERSENFSAKGIYKVVKSLKNGFYTNADLLDVIKVLKDSKSNNDVKRVRYLTLPGEAVISDNGLSYFCVNKKSSETILEKYYHSTAFDKDFSMLNEESRSFINAYYDQNVKYFEYSNENLKDIKIK